MTLRNHRFESQIMTEQRKEDHRLYSTITTDKIRFDDVLCRVYLPNRLTNPINLLFSPTDEQMKLLDNVFEFSVSGDIKGFSGEVETSILADKVFKQNASTQYWGLEITDNVISAQPLDLQLTRHRRKKNEENTPKIIGSFWLTPSIMLSPRKRIERTDKGDVHIDVIAQCKFTLANGLSLTFDEHYKSVDNSEGDTVTYTELIAEYQIESPSRGLEYPEIVNTCHLDDFLTLVSFVERNRCVCLGWEIVSMDTHVKYYRRNVVIPRGRQKSYGETLVDIIDFEEFINHAYKSFTKCESKDLIRQSIQYVVSTHEPEKSLESSFLTLYSALESLLLHFRREQKLETVFDSHSGVWKEFQKDLKEWIGNYHALEHCKDKRNLIYMKIRELNNISFGAAFEKFCQFYSIDLNDLWPVINKSEGITLSEIRNKLIHGDHFNSAQLRALMSAKENLSWILERIILSILGWPVSRSKVNELYLAHSMACHKEWRADRDLLCQNNCT
ncbi:MAG: hypothetical protein ACYC7L_06250 [Nitrospirota bacterium]